MLLISGTKIRISWIVLAVGCSCICSSSNGWAKTNTILEKHIEVAQATIAARLQSIEDATSALQKLNDDIAQQKADILESRTAGPSEPVVYYKQKTLLDWPLDSAYRSHQDYKVVLDFNNASQVAKLDEQYQTWINDGWYIVKSVITRNDPDNTNQSTVSLRLGKLSNY